VQRRRENVQTGVPRIPGIEERKLAFETHFRGIRAVPHWGPTSIDVDFQHLRTLHNLPTGAPERFEVRDHSIEYRIETASYMQHGLITGTNVFAQHLRRGGTDSFMLFAGAPIDRQHTRSFYNVGVRNDGDDDPRPQIASAKLQAVRGFVEKLLAEDEPVLNTMRFGQGVMVGSTGTCPAISNMSASFRNTGRTRLETRTAAPLFPD
jgi:hypothetical protein